MTTTIELREHQPQRIELSNDEARTLAQHPEARLDVRPSGAQEWTVRPGPTVGIIQLGNMRVVIRPKVGIESLILLMGTDLPIEIWRDELHGYETEPDLLLAVIRLYTRSLNRALAQGLRRDYMRQADRLTALRGRIDVTAIARRPGAATTVPCRFDEYTPDQPLNRLLLAALQSSQRIVALTPADRLALRRHIELLSEAAVEPLPPPLEQIERWRPSHLDRHYEPAVRIASLILENLTLTHEPGLQPALGFLVDMDRLVERYLTDQLRKGLAGTLDVSDQFPTHLDIDARVAIRPDLVFLRDSRPVFVADVKYKNVSRVADASTDDLYQLAAYAHVLGVPSAALITVAPPDTSASSGPITHQHTGVQLHVWPVDLAGTRTDIDSQLQRLATRILDTAKVEER